MSSQAWFRLTEVQPIAEHAMACPSHRITTAQVLAGAPLQPALIWTATGSGTDNLDTLSSNGVPVWYDEDGQEHAAPTWTWQQRSAAGARGGSVQSGYGTAYLPLDSARNQLPIIDLLRDGRHTGRHWVAIDIDPTGRHVIRPDAVRLLDHRDEIAPPDATWRPATVTAAAVARGVYPALVATDYTVRGDNTGSVLARFDRHTVEQMVADLTAVHADTNPRTDPMPGEFAILRFDADVLQVLWEHDDGVDERLIEIDRVYPDDAGRYAVGAYLWPWLPTGA
jgi:hypothetical protein